MSATEAKCLQERQQVAQEQYTELEGRFNVVKGERDAAEKKVKDLQVRLESLQGVQASTHGTCNVVWAS